MAQNTAIFAPQNEDQFADLMGQTYRKVFSMAYRLAGNRSDAEDLTQDAFYRAYRSFSDFEGDRPFENWIFRIVTRLYLDLLRNRRRRVKTLSYDNPLNVSTTDDVVYFEKADDSPNAEDSIVSGSFSEELQTVLNSLSPEQRMLVTLADIEEMPYKEIAEIMNKPIGTVRSRLHRTHKIMRSRLEQLRKDGSVKVKRRPRLQLVPAK